jgi:hypothetical protein
MRDARGRHVAAALPGGEVLVAGGLSQYGGVLYSAEVYSPTFVDSEPPVIYAPGDFTVSANAYDPTGQYVHYYPWASDNVDASPVVTCEPPSGSFLLVGTHPVTCSATDSWGNSASAGFTVTVIEPLTLTFTIDAFGSVDKATGAATVSGTLRCNRAASAGVGGQVSQLVANRATLTGWVSSYAQCGVEATPWSATVTAPNGPFNSGRVTFAGWANASDSYSNTGADAQGTIQLRARK